MGLARLLLPLRPKIERPPSLISETSSQRQRTVLDVPVPSNQGNPRDVPKSARYSRSVPLPHPDNGRSSGSETYVRPVEHHSGDAYISLADRAMSSLAQAGIFGSFLVDYLPWLKHAPSWMSFRRKAREWRKPVRTMLESPFAAAKKAWVEGTATDCLVSVELESGTKSEETIKNVAATMYAAGADTVVSGISSFFLVMLLHPELQETGRREIDRVIGKEQRLPLYSDRSQLPFI
ncbi:unnamed protein product, partial [Mycena citricolor]